VNKTGFSLLTTDYWLLTSILQMNRNRKIFIFASIIFVAIIAFIAIDMARRTTAPWNKKKQIVRAFDVSSDSDSIAIDTTVITK
jgi:hypothetical protein